jgi:hypothetical protein
VAIVVVGMAAVGKSALSVNAGNASRRQACLAAVQFLEIRGYGDAPEQPARRWTRSAAPGATSPATKGYDMLSSGQVASCALV